MVEPTIKEVYLGIDNMKLKVKLLSEFRWTIYTFPKMSTVRFATHLHVFLSMQCNRGFISDPFFYLSPLTIA